MEEVVSYETSANFDGYACFLLASLSYSSILRMEGVSSSEKSLSFYRITRRHIPEISTVHNYHFDNLKSKRIELYL